MFLRIQTYAHGRKRWLRLVRAVSRQVLMLILLVVPFADTYQEQEQSLYHPLAYSDN